MLITTQLFITETRTHIQRIFLFVCELSSQSLRRSGQKFGEGHGTVGECVSKRQGWSVNVILPVSLSLIVAWKRPAHSPWLTNSEWLPVCWTGCAQLLKHLIAHIPFLCDCPHSTCYRSHISTVAGKYKQRENKWPGMTTVKCQRVRERMRFVVFFLDCDTSFDYCPFGRFETCGLGISAESTQGIFNMVITNWFLPRTEQRLAFRGSLPLFVQLLLAMVHWGTVVKVLWWVNGVHWAQKCWQF